MKYSLKNEYRHLIYEEPVRIITKDDVLKNNKVTRIYDLITPQEYDPSEIITLSPREIIYHSEIDSFLNKVNISGSNNNFNRKKIELKSEDAKINIVSNIPKIIFNSIFDTIENNIIRGFFNINDFDNSYYDTIEKFKDNIITDADAEFLIQSIDESIEKILGDNKFSDLYFLKDVDLSGLNDKINIKNKFAISIFSPEFKISCKSLIVSIATDSLKSSRLRISKNILREFSKELLVKADSANKRDGIKARDILKTQLIPNLSKENKESKINNLIDMITRYYTDSTLFDIKSKGVLEKISSKELSIRVTPDNVNDMRNILNNEKAKDITNFICNTRNRTGAGEFGVHLLLNTQNVCSGIEPDAIVQTRSGILRCSVKSTASARTGEKMSTNLRQRLEDFFLCFFKRENHSNIRAEVVKLCSNVNYEFFSHLINSISNSKKSFMPSTRRSKNFISKISLYEKSFNKEYILPIKEIKKKEARIRALLYYIKKEMLSEHDASHLIGYNVNKNEYSIIDLTKKEDIEKVRIKVISGNRVGFTFDSSPDFERAFNEIFDIQEIEQEINQESVKRKNCLKEVYPRLFKKKLIKEGGLAGHMMHPYEALDMTPRQIIDRIKEYSTSQSIIEKVDGQNLFFTVEEDGTLMFARNKEDMTHDDLVAKFTGHGAEKPFIEGGNAIKRGVEQWLQSAGPAAEMEIREIFHPDGETKSFINFEIMHPDKPNQIIYDEKYIVFHSIVDYIDGRKTVYSTNKGQRLEKIIRLMDSGISSSGFTLASNRTVNLNKLTNVQIEDYVERVKEVALSLGISENITLGEGIENIIKQEIEGLGINLDRETLKIIYDFVLYGEDRQGNKIKSKDFTSSLVKSDAAGLRSLDLTNATKALSKVQRIISPFKDVFVDLGIDLLRGVKSAYMSDETNQKNIELLRNKLQTAVDDLINYMNENPENYWEPEVHRLRTHLDKVIDKDITDIVATTVEGGVYDYQGDLIKVTGGFAPLNQILGAAYRDKKGIFPTFKQKFMKQESNRRSLKSVFNLIY